MRIFDTPPLEAISRDRYNDELRYKLTPHSISVDGIYKARLMRQYGEDIKNFEAYDYLVKVLAKHPATKPIHFPCLIRSFQTVEFSPVSLEMGNVLDVRDDPVIDSAGYLHGEIRVPILPFSLVEARQGYFVNVVSQGDIDRFLQAQPAPSPTPEPSLV